MQDTLLNLIPGACSPEVHLSQYDKGRVVPFKLADGKSAYTVPEGAEIVVQATKPSGLGFVVPVTFDGDTATMTITETMSNEYGRFPAELSITNGGTLIGTANFVMNIERSPHPEGTIDGDAESLLPELTLLVERIEAAADSVDADTQIVTEAKAEVLQAKADTLQAKADTLSARDESVSAKDLAVSSAQTSVEASQRAEELIGSVSTKADAIVKTASGEIASFSDGGDDLPMKSLKVNIVPKQSGSGDPSPSNVRPISGWSEVKTGVCGKNWLKLPTYSELTANGKVLNYWNYPIKVAPNTQYYLSTSFINGFVGNGSGIYALVTNKASENSPWVAVVHSGMASGTQNGTITSNADGYLYLRVLGVDETKWDTVLNGVQTQLELGSTATTYEPYNGTTHTTSLGQTVYGGTLDVVSGKLTITHALVDLGSLAWSYDSGSQIFYTSSAISGIKLPETADTLMDIYSDIYKASAWYAVSVHRNNYAITIYRTGAIWVNNFDYTTGASFKTAMSGHTFVYPLATPTEITLTPTEVKTLLGNNNIWADAGTVEVEYRADTTLAYNELVAMILENIGG